MTSSLPPRAAFLLAAAAGVAAPARAADAGRPSRLLPRPRPVRLPSGLEACAQIRVDSERLACYDRYVAPKVRGAGEVPSAGGSGASAPAVASAAADAAKKPAALPDKGQYLDEFWELTPERKRGIFNFDGYRPSYFLPLHRVSAANSSPTSPAPGHSGQLPDYRDIEAKLQISVRTKLAEGLLLPNADLWFAYTQQSLWQLYSADISRPFRATDHEPELMYVVPAGYELPGGSACDGGHRHRPPDQRPVAAVLAQLEPQLRDGRLRARRLLAHRAAELAHARERRQGRQPRPHRVPRPHRAARPLDAGLHDAERLWKTNFTATAARCSSTSPCPSAARTRRACAGTRRSSPATPSR